MKQIKIMFLSVVMLLLTMGVAVNLSAANAQTSYNGHRYERFDQSMTWTEAKAYCAKLGGHLVTITSSGEQSAVQALIQGGSKKQYWLGGTVSSRKGKWITGEAFSYSNWGRGEPNNYRSSENYMQMYRIPNPHSYQSNALGKWNDITNNNYIRGEEDFFVTGNVGFVCEYEAIPLSNTTIKLSKTTYVYNGKARIPTVTIKYKGKKLKKNTDYTITYKNNTNIGQASVVLQGKGKYSGTVTKCFVINPPKGKNPSLSSKEYRKVKASWKSVAGGVTGYQIRYSQKKGMSVNIVKTVTGKTSTEFTDLEGGKKYYFQVRAYKTVNGQNYYGEWSSKKSVKVNNISIKLDKTAVTIKTPNGITASLKATVTGTKKKVKWKSNNESVAVVGNGKIYGRAAGTATITATVENVSATCKVTVIDSVYMERTLKFSTLEEWKKVVKETELMLVPYCANRSKINTTTGIVLQGNDIITKREVLEYKEIKHTYKLSNGKTKTESIKCPSKIGYTVKVHVHYFKKGYGNSMRLGKGGIILTNVCSCGAGSEWIWEFPDPEGRQTAADVIQGQNMIVSQQYTHPAMK